MPRRRQEFDPNTSSELVDSRLARTSEESARIGSALFMANVLHDIAETTQNPVFRPIFQAQYYDLLEKAGVRVFGDEILIPDIYFRRFKRIKITP